MTFKELVKRINTDHQFVSGVVRGLYALHEGDEKHLRQTIHKNGVGFSCADAAMFNDLARHINKHGYLTPQQLQACRKLRKNGTPRLAKYQANCDAPDDIATIYHLGPLYNLGYFGNGRSIAVIGQSDFYLADIAAFRAMFNLPPKRPHNDPSTAGSYDDRPTEHARGRPGP